MNVNRLNRRSFLQAAGVLTATAGLARVTNILSADEKRAAGAPHAAKLGWRLGCQAWTFNFMTFFDAVDKTAALGLHYIEAFPNQRVSKTKDDGHFVETMAPEIRRKVKRHLKDNGVKLVSFGVGGYSRAHFDFAKDMGIENLVCEPAFGDFDKLDKLCEEYKINAALHDHPRPSRYWSPDIVLKHVKGHSKRIGACCDTGHWIRSGINPLDALKKLEGRIIEFHFKDLNKYGKDAHDVPWGTGVGDVKAWLTEVKRQGIKPVFSIEYEHHFDPSLRELKQCVAYFDKVAAELANT
jgi:sugar phosphate isomerase/epimerase